MDPQFLKGLEGRAYYAVVKAFTASNKLNFDTEGILMDLQTALDIDDDTAMALMEQANTDQEAQGLKAGDVSVIRVAAAQNAAIQQQQQRQPPRPQAAPAMQPVFTPSAADTPFGQPSVKKHKKGAGGSLPPPASMSRQNTMTSPTTSAAPRAGGTGGGAGASKQKGRAGSTALPTVPSNASLGAGTTSTAPPAGGIANGGLLPSTSTRPIKQSTSVVPLTISLETYHSVMRRGLQDEMTAYLTVLNNREREIFTALLSQGVDESDPDLNECQRELLHWYKLDQRYAVMQQQMATAL